MSLQDVVQSFTHGSVGGGAVFPPQPAASVAVQAPAEAAHRQQRAALAELRGLVPSAAAALLAPTLLEPGFLLLPSTAGWLSGAASPATTSPANGSASASRAATGGSAAQSVVGRAAEQAAAAAGGQGFRQAEGLQAWQGAMAALQQEWPSLLGLLLAGAVERLADGTTPAAHAAAWAQLLLQHADVASGSATAATGAASSGSSGGSSKGGSKGSGGRCGGGRQRFSWQLAQAQASQLATMCLAAQQRQQQQRAGGGARAPVADAEQRASALLEAALALLKCADCGGADTWQVGCVRLTGICKAPQLIFAVSWQP